MEVAVSILRMSNIDTVAHTFDCELELTMSWMDPTIPRTSDHDYIYRDHFFPAIDILNVAHGTKAIPIPFRREPQVLAVNVGLGGKEVRVGMTQRYQCRLMSKMYVGHYPHDVQILEIHLQAREVRPWPKGGKWPATSQVARVILQDPRELILDGHSVAQSADWLPEWRIEKLYGRPATHKLNPLDPVAAAKLKKKKEKELAKKRKKGEPAHDGMSLKEAGARVTSKVKSMQQMSAFVSMSKAASADGPSEDGVLDDGSYRSLPESVSSYTVQVTVARRQQREDMLPLLAVNFLALTVYFVPVLDVAERLTLVVMLLLAILALRLMKSIDKQGGRQPLDTSLSQFMRHCITLLLVQAFFVAVISQMELYMCQQPDVDYWTLNYKIPWLHDGNTSSTPSIIIDTSSRRRLNTVDPASTTTTAASTTGSSEPAGSQTLQLSDLPKFIVDQAYIKYRDTQDKNFQWCFITAWVDRCFAVIHFMVILFAPLCIYVGQTSSAASHASRRGGAMLETEGLLNVDAFHRFHEHRGGATNKTAQKKRAEYPLQSFPGTAMRCVYESRIMKISGGVLIEKPKKVKEKKEEKKKQAPSPKRHKPGHVVPESSDDVTSFDTTQPLSESAVHIETKTPVVDPPPKRSTAEQKTEAPKKVAKKVSKKVSKSRGSKPVVEKGKRRVEV